MSDMRNLIKTLWMIIRAIVNAPENLHWIKKYEAAKREIAALKEQIAELQRKTGE